MVTYPVIMENGQDQDIDDIDETEGTQLAESEDILTPAVSSSDSIRAKFRQELVPMAMGVYKILMLDEDPKVRKAAADSVMKIEGSLSPPSSANAGGGAPAAVFNFDLSSLAGGLRKVQGGDVLRFAKNDEGEYHA